MANLIIVSDRSTFANLAVQTAKLLREEGSDSSMISANFFDHLAEDLNKPYRTFHECKDIMKHLSYHVFDTFIEAMDVYEKIDNWLRDECKKEWWISEE